MRASGRSGDRGRLSIYGKVSHHLIAARDTALAHDSTSTIERMTIEAVVMQIDILIGAVRKLHHRATLGLDD